MKQIFILKIEHEYEKKEDMLETDSDRNFYLSDLVKEGNYELLEEKVEE